MATLRPLFRTFFSRSKLFRSSSRSRNGSNAWPSSRNINRGGYFRSGGGQRDTELGLRSDIAKGVGITTTIKSTSNPDDGVVQLKKLKSSGSGKALRWNESERDFKDDSSEEFLPVQRPTAD
jgi:hypothetical protein